MMMCLDGPGDGQRRSGDPEEAVAGADGEGDPGLTGPPVSAHSILALRHGPILMPGHGVLLRRRLALASSKAAGQVFP
jgi:hypothetical protein